MRRARRSDVEREEDAGVPLRHPDYPGELGPIWVMPDEDLQAAIDRMASSSQARGNAIGYYIAEWDRRMQRRLNRTLLRLTWVIALLTVLLAMLAVIELISR